ncbi:male-specific sperm protein Mst84Da [Drosophila grimshawi]|uniref:GH11632 n=1 Tax=Drosophila grimshawi TaxID=7222 RepID=B4JCA5_DROGR|nr:male-specific sperm protein Mst84Da [Drosophila grimshawi]EDW04138.1 GH11632 [Drosophila grimshawi]
MSYVFNPGYIGPNPPCCDPECTDENDCPNAECGPCPGPQAPCGGCSPAVDGRQQNTTENEDCHNKRDDTQHQTSKQ